MLDSHPGCVIIGSIGMPTAHVCCRLQREPLPGLFVLMVVSKIQPAEARRHTSRPCRRFCALCRKVFPFLLAASFAVFFFSPSLFSNTPFSRQVRHIVNHNPRLLHFALTSRTQIDIVLPTAIANLDLQLSRHTRSTLICHAIVRKD